MNAEARKSEIERLWTLNEEVLAKHGLDFSIDYGTVSYYKHRMEKQELIDMIRQLKTEKAELKRKLGQQV